MTREVFWHFSKPPLSEYDVCAAMSLRYLAASSIVALKSIVEFVWLEPSCFQVKFWRIASKSSTNFRVLCLKVSKFAHFTCRREMQVVFKIVTYNDDNSCHFLSFNYEIKKYEATESLFSSKLFKTHSHSYARRHGVKWIKGEETFCQNS